MRYFIEISYKGTNYHGWQIQQNAISVQQVVQEKLNQLLSGSIEITGSGRTDTGVHAKQQFFHVDISHEINCEDFKYRMNAIIPRDIYIRSIRKVKSDAHARFDATSRSYDYVIVQQKDPFRLNQVYIYNQPLDLDKLNSASKILVGEHDFESFSKVKTQVNHFKCEVFCAFWKHEKDSYVFHIEANRFLRGMVRAIVGTLLLVSEGKIESDDIKKILVSKDRSKAGRSVPSDGLFLSNISYPDHIFEN